MRVALVHDAIYPFVKGGAEKRLYEISKRLAKRHDVHIFGVKWWNGDDVIERDGVKIHGICNCKSLYSGERRSIKAALKFSKAVFSSLAKERFDVVDCYQAPYIHGYAAKLVAKKAKLVFTWHEVWSTPEHAYWDEYLGKAGIIGKAIEHTVLKLPWRIIAVSDKTKSDLVEIGISKEKIRMVPNGINYSWLEKIKPAREKFDLIDVARLIKGKRIDLLLEATALLKKDFPKIKVAIIGDGPEKEQLKELAKKLGVDKNVEFFGFVEREEDVIALMKSSKIFVHPSIQEGGSSIVLFEANGCGLPVIASDHPVGIDKELIEEGKTGYFSDVSASAFAYKIKLLLKSDKLRGSMRPKCIEFAKLHDWDRIANMVEKVYLE